MNSRRFNERFDALVCNRGVDLEALLRLELLVETELRARATDFDDNEVTEATPFEGEVEA
jgi:hypothetical protein